MRMSRIVAPLVAAIGAQIFSASETAAQVPGLYSLPTADFVWSWGDTNLEHHRGVADITMQVAVDFMKPSRLTVPEGANNVKRWHAAVSARPSSKA